MTEQEINIAIAKHFGYIEPRYNEFGTLLASCFRTKEGKPIGMQGVPQWTKCLNEMHKAELSHIIPMTTPCFYDTLQSIIFRDKKMTDENPEIFSAWLTHATALQRAEAFVRTLGLWED
jgi:hypothetical protein